MTPGEARAEGTARGRAALAAAVALAFAGALRRIVDQDYWTHLALGRAFASAGTISVHEPFHALDAPAAAGAAPGTLALLWGALAGSGEWPFQLAVHAVRTVGGDAAVSVAVAGCAALAIALLALPLRRAGGVARLAAGVAFAAGALYVARFRFSPRPEAVAAVLLGALLLLAFEWGERPRWRVLAGMAGVLAAWAPLHVTWAIGAALAGAALAARPRLDFWRGRSRPVLLAAAAVGLLVAWRMARFAAFVLGELRPGGRLLAVTEMRPAWEFPSVFVPFLALSAAGLLLAWGGREGRAARVAVWAVAVACGTIVVRNVGLAALAMVAGASRGLASTPARAERPARALAAAACGAALVTCLAGLVLRDRDYPPGVGVDWRRFPRATAEFVRTAGVEEPVFNSWDWGGYLAWAWAGRPGTFLDGRLMDPVRVAEHDAIAAGDAGPVVERRGFRTAVLRPLYASSGRIVDAVHWFLANPEWRLVHAEDALAFARAPLPPGVAEVPRSEAWRLVLRQLELVEDQEDVPAHAEYTRAIAHLQLGERERAGAALERGRRRAPELAAHYRAVAEAVAWRGP